jgi:hypothetical protein
MNLNVNELTQLINSVGFPIVCCGILFWNNYKLTSTITELTSTLKLIDERIEKLENKIQ